MSEKCSLLLNEMHFIHYLQYHNWKQQRMSLCVNVISHWHIYYMVFCLFEREVIKPGSGFKLNTNSWPDSEKKMAPVSPGCSIINNLKPCQGTTAVSRLSEIQKFCSHSQSLTFLLPLGFAPFKKNPKQNESMSYHWGLIDSRWPYNLQNHFKTNGMWVV